MHQGSGNTGAMWAQIQFKYRPVVALVVFEGDLGFRIVATRALEEEHMPDAVPQLDHLG